VSSGYQSTPSTSTTTQTPYLSGLVGQAGAAAQSILANPSLWPQWYPGATVSPFTPAQSAGIAGIENAAASGLPATSAATSFADSLENGGVAAADPALPALQDFAAGGITDPATNPYLSATMNQLTSGVVPNIVSQFVAGGNLNNPAMAYAASQGATSALAPYLSSLFTTGQQEQLNAAQSLGSLYDQGVQARTQGLALAPQTAQLPFIAPTEQYQAGTLEQNQAQNVLSSLLAQWNFQQTQPLQMVNWAASIGDSAPGGTSTTTTPMYYNPVQNGLGLFSDGTSALGSLATLGRLIAL
jgi:hypothetical protein